jgi:hypothetical protein
MKARLLFRLFLMVSMMFAASAGFLPARAGQPSAESAPRLAVGGISSATQGGVPVLPEGASVEWWQAVQENILQPGGPGSIDGLPPAPNWSYQSNIWNGTFGYSVASAGDVNGDGYDDVIVGAPYLENPLMMEGRVYVFMGSASGLNTTPAWVAESNVEQAMLGSSVGTAGNVNGDGYDDIIVGAYTYSNGQQGEGAAFVWFGSATGLGPNGTPANADWYVESNQENALLGWSVGTAGDVNNDGYDDVIVGAPGYNNKGVAFVYYGSASGLPTTPSWTAQPGMSIATVTTISSSVQGNTAIRKSMKALH